MFRRVSDSLPKDPVVTADLEKLGYSINRNDQVRMIRFPTEKYRYKVHRSDRVNDLYREALQACLRQEVLARLHILGLQTLRLPMGTLDSSPHVPVLTSPEISSAKRVIAYFGERGQDLGVFAYRIVGGDEGVRAGSAVGFVEAIQSSSAANKEKEAPAIVIANPGQLIWCRNQGRAVSRATWEALPRESSVHPSFRLDEETGRNLIADNRDEAEHVGYIFDNILKTAGTGQATIDVIGSEWTGTAVVRILAYKTSGPTWSKRINSLCLIIPLHERQDLLPPPSTAEAKEHLTGVDPLKTYLSFKQFMSTRCRGYIVHEKPLGTLVEGHDEFGCNTYASGEHLYAECIMTRAKEHMLEWSSRLAHGDSNAEEKSESHITGGGKQDQESSANIDLSWTPDTLFETAK